MGIPFSMVIWVAGSMFKDLGHGDAEITVATASIGIVWSLKPFWAGFLDMFKTKKFFVVSTELVIAVLFGVMALALHLDAYFAAIIGVMWVLAFASATQDICSDGIYISSLTKPQQAAYIGVQGMAWNLGRIIAVSGVLVLAGNLQQSGMTPKMSWMYALFAAAGLMGAFGVYHTLMLPTGSVPAEREGQTAKDTLNEFLTSAADFCNKRSLWGMLAFVFFYRSAEGLLLIEAPLFMQGCLEDGALQLSLADKGAIDGTISTVVSIAGGLLGGAFISKFTLKRTLFVLALCVNVPNACYVYLSHAVGPENPLSFLEISVVVSLEKFWYGFGFVGNMLYMMQQLAPGKFKMTHYAFATAFMNLVLVPTQMVSGPLAESMGFKEFFWLVMAAAIPSLIAAWFAPFPQLGAPSEELSVDDDSLLSEDEKQQQIAARRANIWALLAFVVFLYPDVLFLGWMSGVESGGVLVAFLLAFAATTGLKLVLASKAVRVGRRALSGASPTSPYRSNALGAVIGGTVMLAVTGVLAVYCGNLATTTDWSCAFSQDAVQCLQPNKQAPKSCERPAPDRT